MKTHIQKYAGFPRKKRGRINAASPKVPQICFATVHLQDGF